MDTDKEDLSKKAKPVGAVRICTTILQLRVGMTKIWSAVAERSGDTAFPNPGLRRKPRCVHRCSSVVS
jgi:hypothetical protein